MKKNKAKNGAMSMCMTIYDKYIDPFTDFGFKQIFGNENHKNVLIGFLNDLLDIEDKIVSIEYRNLEQLGMNVADRKAVFDILCTDEKNNNFIVELQRSKQKYFKDRSVYYTAFPIQEQSKRGDWDYRLNKIFFVAILEFAMDESENYLRKVQLYDTANKEVFYDKLTYYYIEMPKFKKTEEELKNRLDNWLYALSHLNDLKQVPQELQKDENINELFNIAEFLALSKDDKFAYQRDLKARLDYKNVMDYAIETAIEEGLAKGMKKGIEKGLEKGMEKGIEKGKKEEQIVIALNALSKGMDFEMVSAITGIGIDELKELKSKL